MNAESFIKQKEITWGKPFSNWNRTAFKKALNEFSEIQKESVNVTHCCAEVVCVDNVNYDYLTLGKKYKIEFETENYYTLFNDLGHTISMTKARFDKL